MVSNRIQGSSTSGNAKSSLFQAITLGNCSKYHRGKNLQRIGAKTKKFEAGLLHFPQSYLANMA